MLDVIFVLAKMTPKPPMFAVETGRISSVKTGQMSAVETGRMSAAETGQLSAVRESSGFAWSCGGRR